MKTGKMPNHGEWYIEDQTVTSNGYALLRYCAVPPRIGWHWFGNFGSVEAAVVCKAEVRDRQATGDPWPPVVAVRPMRGGEYPGPDCSNPSEAGDWCGECAECEAAVVWLRRDLAGSQEV